MNTLSWDQINVLSSVNSELSDNCPLTSLAPIVMVGLTGVGKTTVLELLAQRGTPFTMLPNRREITDKIIIATLQGADGQTPYQVADRLARFEYTARYRAQFTGGMAHALGRLAVNPGELQSYLFFDGLRGLDEVGYAAAYFPHARFVLLDAPDTVRLNRH